MNYRTLCTHFVGVARLRGIRMVPTQRLQSQTVNQPSGYLPKLDLFESFITEEEEALLLSEVSKPLKRLRYSPAHFDEAIAGYRELRRSDWSDRARSIFHRIRAQPILADLNLDNSIHVLDLAQDGRILPHVDSVKFVGPVVVGLSLMSPAKMDFEPVDNYHGAPFSAHLPQRSLYIMRGDVRYEYKHAITASEWEWNGQAYYRDRRISMLLREEI
eukprot:TRINITY_DN8020_c0_g1_i3.p3 TRINITY_DN8020_c0_g1~~TRINITY_DN8020_c0_g1_i3.p3  ORF type:complete len:216 (+),score=16.38 TRINITY_DN8020_c0_g1_i3:80-727(+)